MKKIKPIAKFRIYGWKSTLYFHVYVWPHLKDVRKEYNRNKINELSSYGVMAFVRPTAKYKITSNNHRIRPIVGEVHLCKKELGMEVITHESTHAACTMLRRLNFNFSKVNYRDEHNYMEHEELFCYVVGDFARQIVDRIYKLGILVSPTKS